MMSISVVIQQGSLLMKHGKRINSANGYMCQISIGDMLESERKRRAYKLNL